MGQNSEVKLSSQNWQICSAFWKRSSFSVNFVSCTFRSNFFFTLPNSLSQIFFPCLLPKKCQHIVNLCSLAIFFMPKNILLFKNSVVDPSEKTWITSTSLFCSLWRRTNFNKSATQFCGVLATFWSLKKKFAQPSNFWFTEEYLTMPNIWHFWHPKYWSEVSWVPSLIMYDAAQSITKNKTFFAYFCDIIFFTNWLYW